jgi:putative addiction module CopG family antidote
MTIHLPNDLESCVRSQVQRGRFASSDEAIAEAARRLRQAEQKPATRTPPTEAEFKRRCSPPA